MPYRRHSLPPALRPYISSLWIQEHPDEPGRTWPPTTVLPTGTPGLILYYGDPFVRLGEDGPTVEPTLAVYGQRTRAVRVRATGRTGIAIVGFEPAAVSAFLRVPVRELRDRIVGLNEVENPTWAVRWRDRLLAAPDEHERVRLLCELLVERIRSEARQPLAERAVAAIRERGGQESVEGLARRLGVSRRHLNRLFRATVGLGPKRFAEIQRFQAALRAHAVGLSWADVAAASGYHDQAHLIRSWREITGESPARLLKVPATPLARYFNSPPTSRFYKTTYL